MKWYKNYIVVGDYQPMCLIMSGIPCWPAVNIIYIYIYEINTPFLVCLGPFCSKNPRQYIRLSYRNFGVTTVDIMSTNS